MKKQYYNTRLEAEKVRIKGQTIRFSQKFNSYYIIPIKKSFWDNL